MTHRENFDLIFIVGYWVNSRVACFAVCANFWCRGLQVSFLNPCKIFLIPRDKRRKKTCSSAHFHPLIGQNQLEKENDQRFPLNVLITRACRMSSSNSSLVARSAGFTVDRFCTIKVGNYSRVGAYLFILNRFSE